MKVYMMTDLEGVSGVVDFENRADDSRENQRRRAIMRRLLTGEVNAAIAGLFDGGATEVVVNDGHGAGYTIDFEQVDPRVTVIHGTRRPFWLPELDDTFAATIFVGAHARACTPGGVLYHTQSKDVKRTTVNGLEIGELGQVALIAGHFGVPMVLLTGDAAACAEAAALVPGIETVAVKKGLSRHAAVAIPPERARAMIRKGAADSLKLVGKVVPLKLKPPYVWRDELFSQAYEPGVTRAGHATVLDCNTREFRADNIIDLVRKAFDYA
ncbi:MAG: M55 family metallopeptidase [Phycisphaerae bacterium]|nr:M55 family metallopeptidase [Phycisphaerae bacterium]